VVSAITSYALSCTRFSSLPPAFSTIACSDVTQLRAKKAGPDRRSLSSSKDKLTKRTAMTPPTQWITGAQKGVVSHGDAVPKIP